MCLKRFLRLSYIWRKLCTYLTYLHCLQTDRTRLHMTDVTYELYLVRPKWFLRLWYVRCKLCSYLASRWALSQNRLKWASVWVSQPRSAIECVQNDFWACGMFGANHAPILHVPTLSPYGPKQDSTWAMSPKSSIRCIQNYFQAYGTFGPNRAPILGQDWPYLQTNWNKLPLEPRTKECHQVRPKWFLCLWYVWRKPCTYLAPTLTLSPNRPIRVFK
jgi:hypothetical protein